MHDISGSDLISDDGVLKNWPCLEQIFKYRIAMDEVTLPLTGWDKGLSEKGYEAEAKITRTLTMDVRNGLLLMWLSSVNESPTCIVLNTVIELGQVGANGEKNITKRILRSIAPEDVVIFIGDMVQDEVDELCTNLDKSPVGRELRRQICKYFADTRA